MCMLSSSSFILGLGGNLIGNCIWILKGWQKGFLTQLGEEGVLRASTWAGVENSDGEAKGS